MIKQRVKYRMDKATSKQITQVVFAKLCNCIRQCVTKHVKSYEEQGE